MNGVPEERTSGQNSALELEFSEETYCRFYYGTTDNYIYVPYSSLVFPSGMTATSVSSESLTYIRACAGQESVSGVVSYTPENVATAYTMPATVDLPYIAFFSAPERTRDNWLDQNILYYKPGETVFYLLRDGGFSSNQLIISQTKEDGTSCPPEHCCVSFEWVSLEGTENKNLKMTVKSDSSGDRNLYLKVPRFSGDVELRKKTIFPLPNTV